MRKLRGRYLMRNIKKRLAFWRGKTGALHPKPTRNPPPDGAEPGIKSRPDQKQKIKYIAPKSKPFFLCGLPRPGRERGKPGARSGPGKTDFLPERGGAESFFTKCLPNLWRWQQIGHDFAIPRKEWSAILGLVCRARRISPRDLFHKSRS